LKGSNGSKPDPGERGELEVGPFGGPFQKLRSSSFAVVLTAVLIVSARASSYRLCLLDFQDCQDVISNCSFYDVALYVLSMCSIRTKFVVIVFG